MYGIFWAILIQLIVLVSRPLSFLSIILLKTLSKALQSLHLFSQQIQTGSLLCSRLCVYHILIDEFRNNTKKRKGQADVRILFYKSQAEC